MAASTRVSVGPGRAAQSANTIAPRDPLADAVFPFASGSSLPPAQSLTVGSIHPVGVGLPVVGSTWR